MRFGVLVLTVALPTGAMAQTIPETAGIANQVDDIFAPIGGRIGSFILYPAIAAQATETDNVLATDTNRISDEYLTLRPSARLVSQGGRNRTALDTFVQRDFHARREQEDVTQYGGDALIRLGRPVESNLAINITAERLADGRESIENVPQAVSPVKRTRLVSDVGYTWILNRLQLVGGVNARRIDLSNAHTAAGALLDQGFRDYTQLGGRGEARYTILNGWSLVGKASYDRLRYDFGPGDANFNQLIDRDRDSRRLRAEAGLGVAILDKLYGDVTVGYLDRRFKPQPIPIRNVSGFSFSSDILWNIDTITTLKLAAGRDFVESASRDIAGYRSTGGTLRIDRAWTRSVLVSVSARFTRFRALGVTNANIDLNRDEYGGEVAMRYRLNRRYSISATYRHSGRNAGPFNSPFDGNYGQIGVRAAF